MITPNTDNIVTYCVQPVTNIVAEGINSRIMAIKRQSCGSRNLGNFKTAVYFHCDNVDIHPRKSV